MDQTCISNKEIYYINIQPTYVNCLSKEVSTHWKKRIVNVRFLSAYLLEDLWCIWYNNITLTLQAPFDTHNNESVNKWNRSTFECTYEYHFGSILMAYLPAGDIIARQAAGVLFQVICKSKVRCSSVYIVIICVHFS